MTTSPPIEATGLVKRYGSKVALAGVDLTVPAGTVTAVLGPNGAGKTTAVRVLTTLTEADEGQATVAGYDVATHPTEVRRRIGLAAQDATVDPMLTVSIGPATASRMTSASCGISGWEVRMPGSSLSTPATPSSMSRVRIPV